MSQLVSSRIIALIVVVTMLLASTHTAWAAPNERRPSPVKVQTTYVHTAQKPLTLASTTSDDKRLVVVQAYPGAQFSDAERLRMQQRQQQSPDLKQYQGGDVIIIGSGALLVILVVVLIVVLVD